MLGDRRGQLIPKMAREPVRQVPKLGTRNNCRFNKRGQLTIFVIIAIVLVVSILLYIYLQSNVFDSNSYDPEVEVLRENVLDCFRNSYENSLNLVGYQGGYLDVPEPKEEVYGYYFSMDIPYYYYEGEVYYPSTQDIEEEIEGFVDQSLGLCFEVQKESGDYEFIGYDDIVTDVVISENEVTFTTSVEMSVGYNEKTANVDFSESPQIVDSDIFHMNEIGVFIADYLKNNQNRSFNIFVIGNR